MSQSRRDPRVREFHLPTRIVWTSESGIESPDRLLNDDNSVCVLSPTDGAASAAVLLDFG